MMSPVSLRLILYNSGGLRPFKDKGFGLYRSLQLNILLKKCVSRLGSLILYFGYCLVTSRGIVCFFTH